jgi:methylated-DNA-[protein]-cysteine S-methyltransferase
MLLLCREEGALLLCTWPDAEASSDPLAYCAAATSATVAPLVELARDDNEKLIWDSLPRSAASVAEKLDDYLLGRSVELELPIDLGLVRSQFRREVLQALCAVPRQSTTTYLSLSLRVGRSRGAARSVGQAVATNPLAIVVPCHRVLASDGSLGGYSGGLWRKRWLLRLEGHALPDGGWEARRAQGAAAAPG